MFTKLFVMTTIMASFLTNGAIAEDEKVKPGQLSVTGTASVTAEPDEGYISVGVNTKAETAREALFENTTKMGTLFKTLNEFGIQKKDFRTTQFTLSQVYKQKKIRHLNTHTTENIPDGFMITNQLRVTVCELDVFGKVLDALVMGGANRVNSISFGSSEAKAKTDEARVAAVKDALAKANQLLEPLGQRIVRVVSVSISQHRLRHPQYERAPAMMAKSGDVPLSGGSLTFSAQVSIAFDIRAKGAFPEFEDRELTKPTFPREGEINSPALRRGPNLNDFHEQNRKALERARNPKPQ